MSVADRNRRLRLGGLGPLSEPGISWAGRELRDGMELAVERLNAAQGGGGLAVELTFADTRGMPPAGVQGAKRLAEEGVHALVGEFHSVVADAVADAVDRIRLPFVCSSATLDAISARRSRYIFRLAPPQSYGWAIYADFLVSHGITRVAAAIRPDLYWNSGARVLEGRLAKAGVALARLELTQGVAKLADELEQRLAVGEGPDMLLLLIGYPEPLRSLIGELRTRELFPGRLWLGDPAGRPAFPDWWEVAGLDATAVSFLAYQRPGILSGEGRRMAQEFERRHRREPTFVALEGYDSVLALARAVQAAGTTNSDALCQALRGVEIDGSRGRFRFSTQATGVVHQQWAWPPVCVVAYQGAGERFSGLRAL